MYQPHDIRSKTSSVAILLLGILLHRWLIIMKCDTPFLARRRRLQSLMMSYQNQVPLNLSLLLSTIIIIIITPQVQHRQLQIISKITLEKNYPKPTPSTSHVVQNKLNRSGIDWSCSFSVFFPFSKVFPNSGNKSSHFRSVFPGRNPYFNVVIQAAGS